jgi:hypothetical protein
MKLRQLFLRTGIKPAKITWRNIKAVIQAYFRKKKNKYFGIEQEIYEQTVWRRTVMNQKCLNGSCVWCGCNGVDMTYEDAGCKRDDEIGPCYPDMMDKERWEQFKKTNNIKLFE